MNTQEIINIGRGDPTIFRSWWTKHNILPEIKTQQIPLYEYHEEKFRKLINFINFINL